MDTSSKHLSLWGFWDWLRVKEEKGVDPEFREKTIGYLTSQIKYQLSSGPLFVIVTRIEEVKCEPDTEIAFDFRLSTAPPPPSHEPAFGRAHEAVAVNWSLKYGETSRTTTTYGYTFTSFNTLDENRANLRDFVLRQWKEENEVDPLLDE
jgi:hypothetical protein